MCLLVFARSLVSISQIIWQMWGQLSADMESWKGFVYNFKTCVVKCIEMLSIVVGRYIY